MFPKTCLTLHSKKVYEAFPQRYRILSRESETEYQLIVVADTLV